MTLVGGYDWFRGYLVWRFRQLDLYGKCRCEETSEFESLQNHHFLCWCVCDELSLQYSLDKPGIMECRCLLPVEEGMIKYLYLLAVAKVKIVEDHWFFAYWRRYERRHCVFSSLKRDWSLIVYPIGSLKSV